MSHQTDLNHTEPSIRQLRPSDFGRFSRHLLRLDAESRRDRFNGVATDSFVERYARRCFEQGATVIGYVANGEVLAAAELHERPEFPTPTGEIAFSVERAHQNRGLGSQLFSRLIAHAHALGYSRLLVTTHPDNAPMKALARKYHARLTFEIGEANGLIQLAPPPEALLAAALTAPFPAERPA